jgi:hypothetical protein
VLLIQKTDKIATFQIREQITERLQRIKEKRRRGIQQGNVTKEGLRRNPAMLYFV